MTQQRTNRAWRNSEARYTHLLQAYQKQYGTFCTSTWQNISQSARRFLNYSSVKFHSITLYSVAYLALPIVLNSLDYKPWHQQIHEQKLRGVSSGSWTKRWIYATSVIPVLFQRKVSLIGLSTLLGPSMMLQGSKLLNRQLFCIRAQSSRIGLKYSWVNQRSISESRSRSIFHSLLVDSPIRRSTYRNAYLCRRARTHPNQFHGRWYPRLNVLQRIPINTTRWLQSSQREIPTWTFLTSESQTHGAPLRTVLGMVEW
jgi:hypothetical protein